MRASGFRFHRSHSELWKSAAFTVSLEYRSSTSTWPSDTCCVLSSAEAQLRTWDATALISIQKAILCPGYNRSIHSLATAVTRS